jgi:hypothetical protein
MAATGEVVACLAMGKIHPGYQDPGELGGASTGAQARGAQPYVDRSMNGHNRSEDEVPICCPPLPKLTFPKITGDNPRIWIDMCVDYFTIFNILMCMWTTAASLHMEDNATKWLQVYKLQHGLGDW